MLPTSAYLWPPCLSVQVAQDLQRRTLTVCVTPPELFIFKPVFIQTWTWHWWVSCLMHNKNIRHECILLGETNEWDILGYCNEFCFVESNVCRALNPKGTTLLLAPYSSISSLSSLYTEVLYVIETSSPKRHLLWFWSTRGQCHCVRDSAIVWETVPVFNCWCYLKFSPSFHCE